MGPHSIAADTLEQGFPRNGTTPRDSADAYVTSTYLGTLVRSMRTLGLPVESLLARAGLSFAMLSEPNGRIEITAAYALVAEAISEANDDSAPLKLSLFYEPGDFGVVDILAHASASLEDAIRMLCRFEPALQSAMTTDFSRKGSLGTVEQRYVHHPVPRQLSENSLGNLVVIGRKLVRDDFVPVEVAFAHERPRDISLHRAIFRCPIHWEAEADRVVLTEQTLKRRIAHRDDRLALALTEYAQRLVGEFNRPFARTAEVRACILEQLQTHAVSTLPEVAKARGLSPRSLQRQLGDEGTTFREVFDSARKQLAVKLLADPDNTIEGVSDQLGFSDSRALRRAFVRWTGSSPRNFQRALRDGHN